MIDGKNFFDQPVKYDRITYDNIKKIATGQGDDYSIGCLLHSAFFKNYCYKMIVINLSKQQAPDADPKAIQEIKFTGKRTMFSINEQTKETILDFSRGTVRLFWICLILI